MKKILIAFVIMFGVFTGLAHAACTSDQIDVVDDGSNCQDAKFTVTTTNMSAGDVFSFAMSATGTFYVDCGADGVLSGTGVNGKIITRTDTTNTLYTCTYSTGGVKTIRMGGVATGYATCTYSSSCAAIRFGGPYNDNLSGVTYSSVAAIDGSLGAIFPTLGQSNNLQPQFSCTFSTSPIQSVPGNLFSGVTGRKEDMFFQTFINSQLTSIPENLFSGITGAAVNLFRNTFWGTAISSIPPNLFAGISGGAFVMFFGTFHNCANLSGYIPPSTFAGLIANGSPTVADMWSNAFSGTQLATTCPSGTVQYITGYEDYWSGHVSCVDANLSCAAGRYLPANGYECSICPANSYCAGGTYEFSSTTAQGVVSCATGLLSPTGMWEVAQCGRRLHFGDDVVYLRATKKTTHAMHFDMDHDGVADYFANMTTIDTPAHAGTNRRLKVEFGGQVYFVYDDTVNPGQ